MVLYQRVKCLYVQQYTREYLTLLTNAINCGQRGISRTQYAESLIADFKQYPQILLMKDVAKTILCGNYILYSRICAIKSPPEIKQQNLHQSKQVMFHYDDFMDNFDHQRGLHLCSQGNSVVRLMLSVPWWRSALKECIISSRNISVALQYVGSNIS